MRVVPCMLLLTVLCLSGPGCALFKKNGGNGGSGTGAPPPPRFPGGDPIKDGPLPAPPPQSAAPSATVDQAVLTGRVLDPYARPPANTYVRWVRLDDNKEAGAPVAVEVDANGYFFIPGLKAGAQYKLIASSKQGDKVLANIAYAEAPSTKILITIHEKFASFITPAGPAPADGDRKAQGPAETPTKTSADLRTPPATAWSNTPAGSVSTVNNTVPELPVPLNVPSPPTSQNPAVTPPSWGATGVAGNATAPAWPPPLNIQNPSARPQPPPLTPGKQSRAATNVPTCALLGKQLVNLALYDTSGGVWDFRTSKQGKLVLFDFWSTDCVPCRQAMPELNRLQTQYGNQGLEVVGIAVDDVEKKQLAVSVNAVCRSLSYRQLLGEPGKTNIVAQFGARSVPKLVLVDEEGWILWEHLGLPDRATMAELETLLQRRLAGRAS